MSFAEVLFYLVGALAVLSALAVVLHPHPVYSALALIVTLFQIAVLFLLLDAQMIAFLQIIVYAGAIMVLFLFIIMLLNLQREAEPPRPAWRGIALGLGALFAAELIALFTSGPSRAVESLPSDDFGTVTALSRSLFTDYVFAFEITSILLLVAVIGSVVLAKRNPGGAA
jgi:NADH-quinone oxidoreductase subunit J